MNNNFEELRQNQSHFEDSTDVSSDAITLMSIFLAVLKRPWILLLSLVIVLIPLLYYLMNISTVYESSAVVMVSVRETSFLNAISLVEGSRSDVKTEKYYTSILDSRAFRDDVVDHIINLNPSMPKDSVGAIVRSQLGYRTNRREPGFIDIFANSQSKEFALTIAETALDKFQTRSITLERKDALHISDFITNQVNHITNKLEQAEEDLQTFLTRKKLIMIGIETGITQELYELERKHNEAKANLEMVKININSYDQQMNELLINLANGYNPEREERIFDLKNRLTEIRNDLTDADSNNLSEIETQVLRDERDHLRNQLVNLISASTKTESAENPNVGITIQKLENELETALLLQTNYDNQVRFYRLQIDRFRSDHPNLSEDILNYASLSRARGVLQKTLDILLEKREEIRIRVESEMGGIKIIDAPRQPNKPLSRRQTQKLIFGIMAAIVMGIFVSIAIDRFDNSIKDESDIYRSFGLSVFGTIPPLDVDRYSGRAHRHQSGKEKENPIVRKNPELSKRLLESFSEKSPVAEAYRSLKIAIQFLATDKSKKVFVVSSPSVSEGKSLTTANLAVSFAQGGNRMLIIDCDLRKTVQHKYFEVDRKPGLTNFLYGEVSKEEVIRDIGIENLALVSSGSSPSNPAELLASKKMRNFIKQVRDEYDFILIDTPPILVCSDSRVLAEAADGLIMIAKVESTNIKALDHAVNLTKHLNIEILGVILNQVEFRFGRAYYYTYRYYRPYSYYSGYYYKRQYYDYTETETGEKIKVPRTEKRVRRKRSHSKQV